MFCVSAPITFDHKSTQLITLIYFSRSVFILFRKMPKAKEKRKHITKNASETPTKVKKQKKSKKKTKEKKKDTSKKNCEKSIFINILHSVCF